MNPFFKKDPFQVRMSVVFFFCRRGHDELMLSF